MQVFPTTLASDGTLPKIALPVWLQQPVVPRLIDLGLFGEEKQSPNHVLINEYRPGEGILPHEDGPAYAPVVATVSLRAHTILDVYRKPSTPDTGLSQAWQEEDASEAAKDDVDRQIPIARILLEPRSLLVTTDDAYTQLLHGISPVKEDGNIQHGDIVNWDLLDLKAHFGAACALQRETRVSLTYRRVRKVANVERRLFGLRRH